MSLVESKISEANDIGVYLLDQPCPSSHERLDRLIRNIRQEEELRRNDGRRLTASHNVPPALSSTGRATVKTSDCSDCPGFPLPVPSPGKTHLYSSTRNFNSHHLSIQFIISHNTLHWENLMPVNMLSICYNCSPTQCSKSTTFT